jgi:TPR repeat protein
MMQGRARALYLVALISALALSAPAKSDSFSQGKAAFSRGHYIEAARLLAPCADNGNPRAQALLGFLYEHGLGAPQAYDIAAALYAQSAEHGDPSGQYLLGLSYDKGHGVDRNDVLAYKWLNLAAAGAPVRDRENYLKIRNAVASKMSLNQVTEAQWLALRWRPR